MYTFKESEDRFLIQVVKAIVENPGRSMYERAKIGKINRTTQSRKIKRYKLVDRNIIRIELGKRKASNCWLTYKGLLYSIKLRIIKPSRGYEIRIRHNIELPVVMNQLKALNEEMEKNYPEEFYRWVQLGPTEVNEDVLTFLPSFAGLAAFTRLLKTKPSAVRKFIRGKDLVFPDGTVLEDYKTGLKLLMMVTPEPERERKSRTPKG